MIVLLERRGYSTFSIDSKFALGVSVARKD